MPLPALMVSDSTSDQHLFPELLVPKCNTSQWIKSFPLYTNTTHPSNLLPNNESLANPQMFQIKLEIIPKQHLLFVNYCVIKLFSSVAQSCPTLCDPMNRSTPGLPVHHQLPEFTQTHVHRVGDAIQPSHPLSSPSPPAPNPSQHQSLFQ